MALRALSGKLACLMVYTVLSNHSTRRSTKRLDGRTDARMLVTRMTYRARSPRCEASRSSPRDLQPKKPTRGVQASFVGP